MVLVTHQGFKRVAGTAVWAVYNACMYLLRGRLRRYLLDQQVHLLKPHIRTENRPIEKMTHA